MLEFNLNQSIHLPVFCPKPYISHADRVLHSLNVCRTLAFCLCRTHSFRTLLKLFLATADHSKGQPFSSQRISKGVPRCIHKYYTQSNVQPPDRVTLYKQPHRPASWMSPGKLCCAATWHSSHTVTSHYAITQAVAAEVHHAVLQMALPTSFSHPAPH